MSLFARIALSLALAFLYVPIAELAYVGMITLGHATGGVVVWSTGLTTEPFAEAVIPSLRVLVYALAVSALLVFVVRMRDLIGAEVFVNLLVGRYHRPVEEERIFLFVDVVGSTAYAEMHGALKTQAFLGAVFATLAEPVRRFYGSTDDYIGDLAMITWPMERGLKDARCVECLFAVRERIDVPQGPTFAFDTHYQWAPAHRESLRAQAGSVRMGSAITMIVGGVLALGGGAMLIGRELFRSSQRLQQRVDTAGDCQGAVSVMACEALILERFAPEMDDMAFFDRTNQLLATSEGLSVASAILIGAGSAAVITGLIVFFLPPSDEQIDASTTTLPSVSLDVGPGGLSLRGTF